MANDDNARSNEERDPRRTDEGHAWRADGDRFNRRPRADRQGEADRGGRGERRFERGGRGFGADDRRQERGPRAGRGFARGERSDERRGWGERGPRRQWDERDGRGQRRFDRDEGRRFADRDQRDWAERGPRRQWDEREGRGERRFERGGRGFGADDRRQERGPRAGRGFARGERTYERREWDGREERGERGGSRDGQRRWEERGPRREWDEGRGGRGERRFERGGRGFGADDRRQERGPRAGRGFARGERSDERRGWGERGPRRQWDERDGRGQRRFDRDEGRRFADRDQRGWAERGPRREWDEREGRGERRFDRAGRHTDRDEQRPAQEHEGYPSAPQDSDAAPQAAVRTSAGLEFPADLDAKQLDKPTRMRLRSLSEETAGRVALHLLMVQKHLVDDPDLAWAHAEGAVRQAGRIDVVREAAALAAYSAGHFQETLREVRALRRLSGRHVHLAIEADAERALGRHSKALEIIAGSSRYTMDVIERAELAMVEAGIRMELGEPEAALLVIDHALSSLQADEETVLRLVSVKVDTLRLLDRAAEADALVAHYGLTDEETIEIHDLTELVETEEEEAPAGAADAATTELSAPAATEGDNQALTEERHDQPSLPKTDPVSAAAAPELPAAAAAEQVVAELTPTEAAEVAAAQQYGAADIAAEVEELLTADTPPADVVPTADSAPAAAASEPPSRASEPETDGQEEPAPDLFSLEDDQ
ncbi:hypothetical protein [Buchananella hordeovulneris]|uniref:hypothetical protein n=1 Tax=Buchananella hordeovulneris TaxID=52770 RepID=UPI000AE46671|nr:hypothetical protein [Buchananella hordeovulneris]